MYESPRHTVDRGKIMLPPFGEPLNLTKIIVEPLKEQTKLR